MTQQTLREEIKNTIAITPQNSRHAPTTEGEIDEILDIALAHFKESAEKELIGANISQETIDSYDEENNRDDCMEKAGMIARNALRNEQRETLAEFLK